MFEEYMPNDVNLRILKVGFVTCLSIFYISKRILKNKSRIGSMGNTGGTHKRQISKPPVSISVNNHNRQSQMLGYVSTG